MAVCTRKFKTRTIVGEKISVAHLRDAVLILVLLLALPAGARAAPLPAEFAAGLVIRFQGAPSALSALAGQNVDALRPMSGGAYVLPFDSPLPLEEARALAAQLQASGEVAAVEIDRRFTIDRLPSDAAYGQMWNLAASSAVNYGIDAPAAWDITTGDPNLVIAVIDTGVLKLHPDLAGRLLDGYDFVSDPFIANDGGGRDSDASDPGDWVSFGDIAAHPECGPFPHDSSWHGSHVSGTIAAASDNGIGIAGVNWASKVLPLRALGKCGGSLSDVIDALRWAAGLSVPGVPPNPTPARVINMSLGAPSDGGTCSPMLQAAVNDVLAAGAVVVVSAGNSRQDAALYEPANCNGVITVGASEMGGNNASYSNTGQTVEISAPGGDAARFYPGQPANLILSTVSSSRTAPQPDSWTYAAMQGTSMAAPHVTGIVSLMFSANPALGGALAVRILQDTATPFAPTAPCAAAGTCGQAGIAHAGRAVARAAGLAALLFPNDYAPAYAGPPAAPHVLTVLTAPSGDPAQTRVTIGGQPAVILSAQALPGRDALRIQPPAQPAAGYYAITVTLGGRNITFGRAVFYGQTVYLPGVRR